MKLNGPIEVTWSHGEPFPHPHGAGFKCFYCFKKVKGGGVTRLKEHLVGATENIADCPNVPAYIKDLMSSELVKGKVKRKKVVRFISLLKRRLWQQTYAMVGQEMLLMKQHNLRQQWENH